ncbi:MAG: PAS domain S-box protein [Rhodopirellula sp.]|nr:PAS domain S-box protein [Rhodopirellula sp.]
MFDKPPLAALIVIADEERRHALDQPLRKAGFKIRDASNGAEGLRLATEIPDIIILDLHLPDISGFEVCCRLKAHAATAVIPVLHLSDVPVESSEFDVHMENGDEVYLMHPVDAVELLSSVKSLLRGRQAQRLFSSFLEAAPDAVVIVDHEGKIVRVNEQTEKMFGRNREELIEQEVEILMPERFRDKHREQRAGFVAHPNTRPMGRSAELWGLRKDGTEFPVEISLSPIPDHGCILIASIIRDVTERKLADERLRQTEQLQRFILDSIPQKLVTTMPDGSVDYLNPQWMEYTGLTFEQLKDWGWKQFIHPDDVDEHVREWMHATQTGKVYEHESRFRRADGEYRWHVSRGVPMCNEAGKIVMWVGANTDIHDIKLIELALVDSEIRYRRLFETAKDGILILDTESGRITDANPFMSELLGYSHEHFLDKELWEIGLFSDKTANEAAVRTLQDKGYIRYEHLPLETSRRERVEVEVVANAYLEDHHKVIQCNIRDITERSLLEKQMQEQAEALADLDRRKDEFLAMLSHELRNPLAPISNAVHLLRMRKNEEPLQQKARVIIERQLTQLTHLVDDLMEVSRITTGSVQLRLDRVIVSGIVERAVETARPLIDQRRHQLTVSLPPQPIWLKADASRLEQVVVNLLTNAAKYTDEGGHIWLSVQEDGTDCVLRVRDTGVGIAPDLLPRVFDLFTQAERSLDRSQGGLGIGLALVQRLVEMHHGKVEVHSSLGQGSEFVVCLPMVLTAEPQSPSSPTEKARPTVPSLRVLVVDDNVDTAGSLAMLLEASGHEVRIAHDGPTALQAAIDNKPDVVLLDIGLPGMDGNEVAKRIRQQPELENVVLVAMTGYGQDSDRKRSHEAGFDHHLVKPVELSALEKLLAAPASLSPSLEQSNPTRASLRVLVVDDMRDATHMLRTLLNRAGHDVRTAADGPNALAVALDFRPEVALLDISLPGMSGLELAKQIRQHSTLKDIVLVAMTGYGNDADRQRSFDAGFDHHLVKPTDIRIVLKILATVSARGT